MAAQTWPALLTALLAGEDLTAPDTAWAMGQVMAGEATPAQVAAFVVALRAKGETVEEVAGIAGTMLEFATPIRIPGRTVDIVGTGGDRAHTVNISTMAAITVAAAGVPVAKHGNRAASSSCGTADVLEELGLPLDLRPDDVAAVAAEVGITFCFAPVFHASMRFAAVPRREIGIPTVFNILGPLTNPARPAALAVGCADPAMASVMAGVYASRGVNALVVRGDDGLDEVTTTTTTRVWVVAGGTVEETSIDAAALGVRPAVPADLRGGDPAYNADVARRYFGGEQGPVRDAVLINAAAAYVAAADGLSAAALPDAMAQALPRVADAIDSGAAAGLLDRWISAAQARRR